MEESRYHDKERIVELEKKIERLARNVSALQRKSSKYEQEIGVLMNNQNQLQEELKEIQNKQKFESTHPLVAIFKIMTDPKSAFMVFMTYTFLTIIVKMAAKDIVAGIYYILQIKQG